MTSFLIITGILLVLILCGFVMNKVFFSHELDNISPYGELVEVNGQFMHVYFMGSGIKTIVLLPGMGVPLPSADFGPLMRALSREFTVVCIEYFGYGFSDKTQAPRTNEKIMSEIRLALSSAGFEPPYVLMPHSASGIYSEYYAAKHPEEIMSIIMLDTTSSALPESKVPRFVYQLAKLQQAIGLNRITNSLATTLMLKKSNGYTESEIADYKKFFNHTFNETVINQQIEFSTSVNEVMQLEFPNQIPVLKIVPTGTIKQTGEAYQTNHLSRLGEHASYITLNGNHFIYHNRVEEIYEAATDFFHSE